MAWKKGQSGNPKGRPKELQELKLLAQTYTQEAFNRLVEWMHSDNAKASVAASNAILDRGWGKPSQDVNANIAGMAKLIVELTKPDE